MAHWYKRLPPATGLRLPTSIYDEEGNMMATTYNIGAAGDAVAEMIVQRVNAHDKLIEAAQAALKLARMGGAGLPHEYAWIEDRINESK